MALFGKLFEKKYCSVCNAELGVFGKTKLSDGLLCKECAGKLSPYFTGARQTTVDKIREQLSYREQNKKEVERFNPTRTLGTTTKIYIDEDEQRVIITRASDWRSSNPDVFEYDQITGCSYEVDETSTEQKYKDADGVEQSYNPPRFDYEYDFYVNILVNHPYVSGIRFKYNRNTIERKGSAEYMSAENACKEISDALTQVQEGVRAAKQPRAAMQCPHCLATTVPDASGRCEYCGGALT